MNIQLAVTPPPAAPEPPKPNTGREDAIAANKKQADFQKLIHDEVEKKKALEGKNLPTPLLPWLATQAPVASDNTEEELAGISAANALSAGERAAARAFAASLAGQRPVDGANARGRKPEEPVDFEAVKPTAPKEADVTPVHVVVEAGLPPVQPTESIKPGQDVPLAQLPQAVAGTARQLVKDNQAITQLDFQITPPHVGPVNLEVSLQDRVVSIQIVVPNIQAKHALEGQMGNIASILQAQNLTAGPVRIVTAAAGKSGAGAMGAQGEQAGFGLLNGGRKRAAGPDDMTAGSV
ncbi:MAG: Flagellar hook-length control protein FliK [Cyanobacteria bacterium RYN_339]|nr:Flagellar hook-length control protein FliK [Cyanobacteria bacterium RYN_339]